LKLGGALAVLQAPMFGSLPLDPLALFCDGQKRTRIELCFMCYNSNMVDVVFAKARRKARI